MLNVMNNGIKQFYDALINLVNNCGLPVGVAYFVLKDITDQLQKGFEQCAVDEAEQQPQKHSATITMPQPHESDIDEEEKEDGSNTVTENL